ncbi:MAG: hypothetical protein WBQ25_24695 [Nitrososphaeraceae archaeon]
MAPIAWRLKTKLSRKDTVHTFDIEIGSLYQQSGEPIIIVPEDGLQKEPTPGTTGSENFWLDTKRS